MSESIQYLKNGLIFDHAFPLKAIIPVFGIGKFNLLFQQLVSNLNDEFLNENILMIDKTLDIQQTGFCDFNALGYRFEFFLQNFQHNITIL